MACVWMEFAVQDQPCGLADFFIIGADFVSDDRVELVLAHPLLKKNCCKYLTEVANGL